MNALFQFSETGEHKHGADGHWAAMAANVKVGECSLWWQTVPQLPGERLGVIGHYSASEACGPALLNHACEQLRSYGCTMAVGPMDGNTWRSYRLMTERGPEPPFFLETNHPPEWPDQFRCAGFTPLAEYTSALADDLDAVDPRIAGVEQRLSKRGITLRSLRMDALDEDLQHIYAVSIASFQRNFLFTPIAEGEFMEQYRPIRDYVRPELVILAFDGIRPVGFVFAIPDYLEPQRGAPSATVVLKTLAVLPGPATAGLGNLLLSRIHEEAKRLGFKRVIHALMHESNTSRNLSAHYATNTFRRYTLFSRRLAP